MYNEISTASKRFRNLRNQPKNQFLCHDSTSYLTNNPIDSCIRPAPKSNDRSRSRNRTRASNSTHNAEVRSSIGYLTERLTTDELVAPKTTLRAAVLRRGLRGHRRQHRGPRLARGVAATGLLRTEPDSLLRHGAEGPAEEAEAVRSHRLWASCHDETGRRSARWVKPMYVPAILYDREWFSSKIVII